MKLLSFKIFNILLFYQLLLFFSNEKPDIKNLIVHSQSKQISDVNFTNIRKEQITLNDFKGKLVILNFFGLLGVHHAEKKCLLWKNYNWMKNFPN